MRKGRNWTHAAGVIWPDLVAAGRNRQTLTYETVAKLITTNPLSVAFALDPIQNYCLENRLAPLTVVVVGKTSGVPGDGFVAWDVDDLAAARDAVQMQNWDLVGNPFEGFGPGDDEHSLASRILVDPAAGGEVYRLVRDRGIAQRIFRQALLTAYEGCALCGLTFPAALEAAHILPWGRCAENERLDVANGLLLCSTHHRLFDDHTFKLGADLTIIYYDPQEDDGPYSEADRALGSVLHGQTLRLPVLEAHHPNGAYIERRYA